MLSYPRIFRTLLCSAALAALVAGRAVAADSEEIVLGPDPRGPAELVVCSQNLHNYGLIETVKIRQPGMTPEDLRRKEAALVQRFVTAGCDVIAVQELLARNEFEGRKGLLQLAEALRRSTNRVFDAVSGPSNEYLLRVGFLVARDRAAIVGKTSFLKVQLPKLTEKEKPRFFNRAPLEIQISVKPQGGSYSKAVTLINFHSKSRAGKGDDPSGLEWEPLRMQMAEAIRRVVETRHGKNLESGDSLLLVLGDRNANFDLASARILEGALRLKDFQKGGVCRLSKRGVPLCKPDALAGQELFSVLTTDPHSKNLPGTFLYNNIYSWLDDILMPGAALGFASASVDSRGDYESGVVYEPRLASDHALVWVRLNW